jgi:DNA modification methylase
VPSRPGRPDAATLTPFVDDPDFTLYVGGAREVLATLPAGSVDCCVTSPPYWGLRDYGTGSWEGGDEGCDHQRPSTSMNVGFNERWGQGAGARKQERKSEGQWPRECPACGARRVDRQLGLESTPEEYVAALVGVFREVRRVLADTGTLWLNLGDSYSATIRETGRNDDGVVSTSPDTWTWRMEQRDRAARRVGSKPGLAAKNLVGIPWRVAFALQADGWYLRSDIIWAKPSPMPESVTDRPTKAHEYVFLLAKQPRYWFDQEAVREPGQDWTRGGPGVGIQETHHYGAGNGGNSGLPAIAKRYKDGAAASGRNVRSVWEIATQPYADAHFATFPEELARRCILAGCPEWVCGTCGKPRERIVQTQPGEDAKPRLSDERKANNGFLPPHAGYRGASVTATTGWSDCGHGDYRPGTVLDPFMGSGTTALVARKLGRRAVGVELNETYARLAARRLQQLSLLA